MSQKHPIRSFFLSLGFFGLAWLAFNPQSVVELQNRLRFSPSPETPSVNIPVETKSPSPKIPRELPTTALPDADNLPRIADFEKIARDDPWIGPTPCSEHMFFAPATLSTLSPRVSSPHKTTPIKARLNNSYSGQPSYLYKSERGATLELVKPVIEYYDLKGRTYRDVRKDIFSRRPLEILRQAEKGTSSDTQDEIQKMGDRKIVTLADIASPTSLSYYISGSRERFQLNVKRTNLTVSFQIRLPRWQTYNQASEGDQKKWDDLLCNAAHHELGHLRIRLDMLAETLDGYADLPPASSFKEMEEIVIAFRKDINDRVEARQDAYHIYNGGGTRRGMVELPYAELPFPWLADSEIKTAEQLPE